MLIVQQNKLMSFMTCIPTDFTIKKILFTILGVHRPPPRNDAPGVDLHSYCLSSDVKVLCVCLWTHECDTNMIFA